MTSTDKLKLLIVLLAVSLGIRAEVDAGRIFQPITASDGLADNSAQTIKCTFSGRMTITTIGNINFYDGASFSRINPDQEFIYRLDDYHGHYHLYYDNNHHLWLKSSSGVACVNLTREQYVTNMDSLFATYDAKERVGDMFIDINGDVWLTDGNYIFSTKYRKKVPLKKQLNLQDLEVYKNRLLMLFYGDGLLVCYDLKRGCKLYQCNAYSEEDAKTYYRSGVQLTHENCFYMIRNGEHGAILMCYDVERRHWSEVMRSDYHLNNMVVHDGKLYIASEWGYFTYDFATGDINHYKTLTLKDGRKLETDINVIEFDLQGGMWLGTEKRGLLYGGPLNANFKTYDWDDPRALEYEAMMRDMTGIREFRGRKASVIFHDSREWTWVGTPNGLYLYMSPKAEPMVFSPKNGLLNSVIHAVIEDDMHNIWASTSYGIVCVVMNNSRVKQVFCFSGADNVPSETFIDAKAMKLPTGEIVMQALDHVVSFNPKDFLPIFNQEPYVMYPKLSKLLVNGIEVSAGDKVNGVVVLDKAITRTKEINLNSDLNYISLTFSALNYARPLQTYYRVKVREQKDEWTEYSYFSSRGLVDRRGLLHFPLFGLKPGTYHIELQASTVPGKWLGKPFEWVVNIRQPWWRTTGVMALIAVLVFAVLVLNFIAYNRNTRLRIKLDNEEGDVIRRIVAFVSRCDGFNNERLSPTQEEIYGTDTDQTELSDRFVELMLKVIPYVREREGRPFTMNMLSDAVDMELREVYELVSENVHKSPRALIRTMRVNRAAELLRTTDLSLERIAAECGFVSPNYMIAKFYHQFRLTPAEYRSQQ